MGLQRLWVGSMYGTNPGNLFIQLEGTDSSLEGALHLKEYTGGRVVFAVKGDFDGQNLSLSGEIKDQAEGTTPERFIATAHLTPRGELRGKWSTDLGSAGTFTMFATDVEQNIEGIGERTPDGIHTARCQFGAVEVSRSEITEIADTIQRDFRNSQVVVTVAAESEQTRLLQHFKDLDVRSERAAVVKLYAQEPETAGISRIASVEFTPHGNWAMIQGGDEAWVFGMLEKLKRSIKPLERSYATNFAKFGFGFHHLLLAGTAIYLPSLETLRDRAVLVAGVLFIIYSMLWLNSRYLPFAAIYLGEKPRGLGSRIAPSVISWIIAATAGVAATILAVYLQGQFLTQARN